MLLRPGDRQRSASRHGEQIGTDLGMLQVPPDPTGEPALCDPALAVSRPATVAARVATTRPTCRGRHRSCRCRATRQQPARDGWRRYRADARPLSRPARCGDGPGRTGGPKGRTRPRTAHPRPTHGRTRAARRGGASRRTGGSDARCHPSATHRPGMGRAIDTHETLGRDLGVDLGRRDRGVTKQLLDGADVGAVIEHVSGTRMPEHMRRESSVRPTTAPRSRITP